MTVIAEIFCSAKNVISLWKEHENCIDCSFLRLLLLALSTSIRGEENLISSVLIASLEKLQKGASKLYLL